MLCSSQIFTELSLVNLLNNLESGLVCVSVKNHKGLYRHANKNFSRLMGHNSSKTICGKMDAGLTENRHLLKTIRRHDEKLFDEAKAFDVCEILHPMATPAFQKEVRGRLYPIFAKDKSTPCAILGIFQPVNNLLYLSLDVIFRLSFTDLQTLLVKRSFEVKLKGMTFNLSRQEIMVIIGVVKGLNANEISIALCLQQTTVEGYLQHVKNKLGINLKHEIISAVVEGRLLETIML
jgi:DNA-binding CsgD family transcriptional regulator